MNKIILKKRHKRKMNNKISIIIFIILIGIFSSYMVIKYFNEKIVPVYLDYAESEVKKILTLIVNKAVTKQMAEDMDVDLIFDVIKNEKGDVQLIEYNSVNVTKILNKITNYVQLNLKCVEEGDIDNIDLFTDVFTEYDKNKLQNGIIYEIPTFAFTKNVFLSNLGPRIPVKLQLIGDVVSGLDTKVLEYGINNALIEVSAIIEVSSMINLPFASEKINVTNNIPISMKIIQGNIPSYYFNGMENFSNLYSKSLE